MKKVVIIVAIIVAVLALIVGLELWALSGTRVPHKRTVARYDGKGKVVKETVIYWEDLL